MDDLTFGGLRQKTRKVVPDNPKNEIQLQAVQAYALIQIAQELNEIKVLLENQDKRARM
jgi:hypothetical protein